MEHIKNYYEILGVSTDASFVEIKDNYRYKANILHPDHTVGMAEPIRKKAEEEFKWVNVAYETLSNPEKRHQYDIKIGITNTNKKYDYQPEGFQKTSKQEVSRQNNPNIPPKPEVYPTSIKVTGGLPYKKQTASFWVKNTGGKYTTISINNPRDCITGIKTVPLQMFSKLPMRVDVEVMGIHWGRKYSSEIKVRLDEAEAIVKIELQMDKKE